MGGQYICPISDVLCLKDKIDIAQERHDTLTAFSESQPFKDLPELDRGAILAFLAYEINSDAIEYERQKYFGHLQVMIDRGLLEASGNVLTGEIDLYCSDCRECVETLGLEDYHEMVLTDSLNKF